MNLDRPLILWLSSGMFKMLGEALTLLAAFCWSAGAGFYKRSMRSVDPVGLNLVRSIPATAFLFLMTLLSGGLDSFHKLDLAIAGQAVGASLISWLIGDTLYFLGLRSIGVSRAVPIAYSYPLFIPYLSYRGPGPLHTPPHNLGGV